MKTSLFKKTVAREYRQFRNEGKPAQQALRNARIVAQFDRLYMGGFVRIVSSPDDSYDSSELDERDKEIADRDGVWGTIGQYRLDAPDDWNGIDRDYDEPGWEQADSVWGHIGYNDVTNPHENPYVIDHMQLAIDALRNALKARFCQHCGNRVHA